MKNALWLFAAFICLHLSPTGLAQDAVPGEILSRTLPIRVVTDQEKMISQGTTFAIDYEGKTYAITAKHVLEGVKVDHPQNLEIRQGSEWKKLPAVRVLYPSSPDADIGIIETTFPITQPYAIETMGGKNGGGLTFGQPVWFLGYPYVEGLGTKFRGETATSFPFIKKGIISAIDASNPDAQILYVDGFNNHGFSGGPIVFYDFSLHKYFIAGVIHGFRNDAAETVVNGKSVQTSILVNSGILIGYNIIHALDAIKDAPPLKSPAK